MKYNKEEISKIAHQLNERKQEIIKDLNNVKLYEAIEKYENLLSFMDKNFPDKKEVNIELIGLRIYFLEQRYNKVLGLISVVLDLIKNSRTYDENIKGYFRVFVYNIQVISALFLDDVDLANKVKEDYSTLCFDLEDGLFKSLYKQYPIYHHLDLKEFFKLEYYTEKYSEEKLAFIFEYLENMHNEKIT